VSLATIDPDTPHALFDQRGRVPRSSKRADLDVEGVAASFKLVINELANQMSLTDAMFGKRGILISLIATKCIPDGFAVAQKINHQTIPKVLSLLVWLSALSAD